MHVFRRTGSSVDAASGDVARTLTPTVRIPWPHDLLWDPSPADGNR